MGQLVYAGIGSLDGYIADVNGDSTKACRMQECTRSSTSGTTGWLPSFTVVGLYEVMKVWETFGIDPDAVRRYVGGVMAM